jgi:hypothetical protein
MGEPDKKPETSSGSSKKKWGNWRNKRQVNKTTAPTAKFQGGKEELDGNHFDCTGYGQSDRFVRTVQKIADYIGQEYKGGGVTRSEVINIPLPMRPVSITPIVDGTVTRTPPDVLDISDYQSKRILSITRFSTRLRTGRRSSHSSGNSVRNQCTQKSKPIATTRLLNRHSTELICYV